MNSPTTSPGVLCRVRHHIPRKRAPQARGSRRPAYRCHIAISENGQTLLFCRSRCSILRHRSQAEHHLSLVHIQDLRGFSNGTDECKTHVRPKLLDFPQLRFDRCRVRLVGGCSQPQRLLRLVDVPLRHRPLTQRPLFDGIQRGRLIDGKIQPVRIVEKNPVAPT